MIERLEQEFSRYPLVEEFIVESELDEETAKEIYYFIRDDVEIPEDDSSSYELIIRRGLGNNELKKLRVKSNLTQAQLGIKLGFGKQTVTSWETCRAYPSEYQRKKVAKFFRVDENNLFPKWLEFIADEIKNSETEKVVEIGKLRLNNPDVLMIEDDTMKSPERIIDQIKGKELLEKAEKILTPKELSLIRYRFGFEDGSTHTLVETGREYGVTQERIRQIEAKAIEKIRNRLVSS